MKTSHSPSLPGLPAGSAILALSLLFFGFHYVRPGTAPATDDGEEIYMTRCMSCHQAAGQGINGVFPPLDGSEWVTGDKGRLIRIVLQGLTGEVVVKDATYSGSMPPWNAFLNDEQIAAVLTYIRSAWNNEADAVTPAEVTAVREATKDRTNAWDAGALAQEENTGIPGMAPLSLPGLKKADADSTGGR